MTVKCQTIHGQLIGTGRTTNSKRPQLRDPWLVCYCLRYWGCKKKRMPRNWCFLCRTRTLEVILMVSKRAYSRVKVKSVDVDQLISKAKDVAQISLGLDIGKLDIVACLRWSQGQFDRPWSVNNPFDMPVTRTPSARSTTRCRSLTWSMSNACSWHPLRSTAKHLRTARSFI